MSGVPTPCVFSPCDSCCRISSITEIRNGGNLLSPRLFMHTDSKAPSFLFWSPKNPKQTRLSTYPTFASLRLLASSRPGCETPCQQARRRWNAQKQYSVVRPQSNKRKRTADILSPKSGLARRLIVDISVITQSIAVALFSPWALPSAAVTVDHEISCMRANGSPAFQQKHDGVTGTVWSWLAHSNIAQTAENAYLARETGRALPLPKDEGVSQFGLVTQQISSSSHISPRFVTDGIEYGIPITIGGRVQVTVSSRRFFDRSSGKAEVHMSRRQPRVSLCEV
ncbi:predicted protein [Aspergillus nidulans FGSC A4]|uniref:Uncharacterized protein n=1 Tax=Emericella nidulans (strain FGSC A4 / ATCC 38163 / CBS 112.46 / NRRL 194 / M139) TaxID=227321 RepID=Q5BGB7_EMENI|nr:hypothetical protein [Aspergillus nidulans FGSC A4]EAA66512.1 predicted protein [Aspergillus nidulans FGSC A4]CBF89537.1 TPA: conserved hypothetical protein [Aspergillus nidulans FGSC A4]|eukprot:XP_658017.1 predicted protein [Aspergillus nidulans FGSC A4]